MTRAWKNEAVMKALKIYGPKILARTSITGEFEAFLERIAANGECALEIGTYNGLSAVVLARFFKRVVCVTLEEPGVDLDLKRRVWRDLGFDNIEAVDLPEEAAKRAAIADIPFDFAYLDGDHVNCTASDFRLVERCGRVLFHEYWPIQPPVWNFVNVLPADEVTLAEFDCFAFWQRKQR